MVLDHHGRIRVRDERITARFFASAATGKIIAAP
jgi:hypothetical protein